MLSDDLQAFEAQLTRDGVSWQAIDRDQDVFYCLEMIPHGKRRLWLRKYLYAGGTFIEIGRWRAGDEDIPADASAAHARFFFSSSSRPSRPRGFYNL